MVSFVVATLAVTMAACAHAPQSATPSSAASAAVPATPAGEGLAWFVRSINDAHGVVTEDELVERFSGDFLSKVPASQLVQLSKQFGQQIGNVTLESVEEQSPLALVAKLGSAQGLLRVSVAVEPEPPHRIVGLLIGPDIPARARPTSWEEVETALGAIAPRTNLLAARLEPDRCVPVREVGKDEVLALGSAFKLYVLLAASEQISGQTLSWQTPIAVRDSWKSLPSGTLQHEKDGKELPLVQIARQMISISDNTATDHLIRTVGRDAVERMLDRTRHASATRNRPFLTTREFFQLKLAANADQERYLGLDEAGRRAFLEELDRKELPPIETAAEWKAPRAIDTLEWFASTGDLCQVALALREAGQVEGSPVLDILAQNPGVRIDRDQWSYAGFKGGSEPGVMNLTFLLRRKSDDAWFFFSVGANDTRKEIDAPALVAVAEGALELLGK
ncbi:serine hydrolase [Vulgatibacter incomptus]|uniref:Putative beta-lactamase n=1 Tax=Vulgatibacter incomptus TaxID=1391653 RepID=A0A0K1PHY3_9BACT|nr:serine hydrolase [Vulgatibacter incomptus]AKU93153.1 putative beta-lactamase [Vulgatibacter incomptus]